MTTTIDYRAQTIAWVDDTLGNDDIFTQYSEFNSLVTTLVETWGKANSAAVMALAAHGGTGQAANSVIQLHADTNVARIIFQIDSNEKLKIDADGVWFQDASNGIVGVKGVIDAGSQAYLVTEGGITAYVTDKINAAGARVYDSGTQSIPNNTYTALTFNSERWDYGTYHSTVSNTTRLTVPVNGLYMVTGGVAYASNATGQRALGIRVNGSSLYALERVDTINGQVPFLNVSTIVKLTAGDYVELMAWQNSGGSLNTSVNSAITSEFAINMLARF